jgi:acetyl esterase/lipase
MVRGGDLLGRCNQHSGASSIASGTRCGLPVWCHLGELADAYAPAPVDRKDPLISPLFADFSGFPADARLIQVGSAETLLDDASRLAAAMGAADVAVTLEIWPRMIHAWALWNVGNK